MEMVVRQTHPLQRSSTYAKSDNWAGLVPGSGHSTSCIGRLLGAGHAYSAMMVRVV